MSYDTKKLNDQTKQTKPSLKSQTLHKSVSPLSFVESVEDNVLCDIQENYVFSKSCLKCQFWNIPPLSSTIYCNFITTPNYCIDLSAIYVPKPPNSTIM